MITQSDITWMIRAHLPDVLDIECQCYAVPWTEDDFLATLRQKNCIGLTAQRDELTLGFVIYELLPGEIRVLNFAVAPEFQRKGVGTAMVEKLRWKLSAGRRSKLSLEVRDGNLPALMFFREMGFRAVGMVRDCFWGPDGSEDGIKMEYRIACDTVERVNAWESVPQEAWEI